MDAEAHITQNGAIYDMAVPEQGKKCGPQGANEL